MKFPIPPGVFDITPHNQQENWKSSYLWGYVEKVIREISRDYGFLEIRTPLFERTELFQRSVGENSDIVSKEMYTFEDKGGRSLSLRPEGTAPVMRSFIENQMQTQLPTHKLFYIAPMFRYERAQAGRYRQHHQFGTEVIGNGSAEQDVEVIDLLHSLYQRLGLSHLTLYINSIGDADCRQKFKTALKVFLKPHFHLLSPDSQTRFEINPLRILDSKDPRDQELVAQAPSILDFLNSEDKKHFEEVKQFLDLLGISYKVNPLLVRGLDYYNKTVFEFVAGELGAQNSIGGGGRYDGLLHSMGGPDLPSVGFGTGIERIIQTMLAQEIALPTIDHPTLFIIALGEEARKVGFKLLHDLRQNGVPAQMDFTDRKLGKIMQFADQIHSTYVAVLGENEITKQEIELKEMATGKKTILSLKNLPATLRLDVKNPAFIEMWKEVFTPFETAQDAQLFYNKIRSSLDKTKEMTEHLDHNLDKLVED